MDDAKCSERVILPYGAEIIQIGWAMHWFVDYTVNGKVERLYITVSLDPDCDYTAIVTATSPKIVWSKVLHECND